MPDSQPRASFFSAWIQLVQLVSQHEMLKINTAPSRHLQVGSKISRRNKMTQRQVTKYNSSTDSAIFEVTVIAPELFHK
jgi:hypothetical protein